MDIKVYTMVEAVHLSGTASLVDSDDLSAWSQTYSSMPEAKLSVKNAIQRAVYEFYEGSDMTCDELDRMVDVVFGDRNEDGDWVWDPADRSYLWRIVEDVLYVPCECEDESDTTMEQLGYRKDDSEHVDESGDYGCKYPKLSVWFENASTPGSELGMEFSTPEEALAWASAYDGGNSEFSSTWLPCVIRAVTQGYARDIHDCAGNWEDFIGELAYACGDDGSFADPDELERRNKKYREWYKEDWE